MTTSLSPQTPSTPTTLPIDTTNLVQTICEAIDEVKGEDIIAFEVTAILGITDVFVLCSATSPRQVDAIADRVEENVFVSHDRKPGAIEGLEDRRWVLLDYGDVIVHVFHAEERAYYRLERLYGDAPRIAVDLDQAAIRS